MVSHMTARIRSALTHPSSCILALALLLVAQAAQAQRPTPSEPPRTSAELAALDLEQLMRIEVVFAASKRAQQTRDVPSFVSVVTAQEIKEHGYRTIGDVLKTLPSFYVSNDRNYTFLGVRGFERPGDYNSRVLLLLNGLRTNDNVYAQAYIGEESLVDVDLIDRIEVIRGPSAALYGSNAFFAVINVVTKPGRSVQGEVATTAASYGTLAGRTTYGRGFGTDMDLMVSASYLDSDGQDLYFPEFDDPSTNNGIARGADRESARRFLATLTKGGFSLMAASSSREKYIPTGSYGTAFNDPRSFTVDGTSLVSMTYARAADDGSSLSARLHAGRWIYEGSYAYDPTVKPSLDDDVGDWWGVDLDASRALSRHFLTAGLEFRDDVRQNQKTYDPEPYFVYTDLKNQAVRWGMFAQDEVTLLKSLKLHAGVRYDHYETFGSATSPRVGLILTPGTATTVKLLAGRAFRAPNEYEMYYASDLYKPNPQLQPERIETLELVAQRLIGRGVQVSASGFRNRLSDLISQRVDTNDNNRLIFENLDRLASKGVELGLDVNRGRGVSGQLTYALQKTTNVATGAELSNSPRHMAKMQLRAPLNAKGLTTALDAQYVSSRLTTAGNKAGGFAIANMSLLAPRLFKRVDLSASVYNLFDTRYGVPGAEEHVQDIIQQDGRNFRVKTTLHF
jgi:outer membrane receptor for ferrienterochelin and colicin